MIELLGTWWHLHQTRGSIKMLGKSSIMIKSIYEGMSLCGGMQPTTASLMFLLTDEFKERKESIQSLRVGLFFLK